MEVSIYGATMGDVVAKNFKVGCLSFTRVGLLFERTETLRVALL